MIVKDQQQKIEIANEISGDTLNFILGKSQKHILKLEDDPADIFYLMAHIVASLNFKIKKTMEEYAKIYGVEQMDYNAFDAWVITIEKVYRENYPKEHLT